jgi:hypothetical protein
VLSRCWGVISNATLVHGSCFHLTFPAICEDTLIREDTLIVRTLYGGIDPFVELRSRVTSSILSIDLVIMIPETMRSHHGNGAQRTLTRTLEFG